MQMADASSAPATAAPAVTVSTSPGDSAPAASAGVGAAAVTETEKGKGKDVAGVELEDESVYREREGKELETLLPPDIKNDVGSSTTGQYELVGESPLLPFILPSVFLPRSCLVRILTDDPAVKQQSSHTRAPRRTRGTTSAS